jgi:hypothetical protein
VAIPDGLEDDGGWWILSSAELKAGRDAVQAVNAKNVDKITHFAAILQPSCMVLWPFVFFQVMTFMPG